MVCLFPTFRILAIRNRDPSSMIKANSYSCWLWGWIHFPPSALTVINLGGMGSKEAFCFTLIFLPSSQTEHRNWSTLSITSLLAPRAFKACFMCRLSPCPVAAWSKYSFRSISLMSFSFLRCCPTYTCSSLKVWGFEISPLLFNPWLWPCFPFVESSPSSSWHAPHTWSCTWSFRSLQTQQVPPPKPGPK